MHDAIATSVTHSTVQLVTPITVLNVQRLIYFGTQYLYHSSELVPIATTNYHYPPFKISITFRCICLETRNAIKSNDNQGKIHTSNTHFRHNTSMKIRQLFANVIHSLRNFIQLYYKHTLGITLQPQDTITSQIQRTTKRLRRFRREQNLSNISGPATGERKRPREI